MNDNTIVPQDEAEETSTIANGKKFKYFFKTEKLTDADGNEVGEARKHPDVEVVLPVPTKEDLINYLQTDEAVSQLLLDAATDLIFLAGRSQINDWRDSNPEKTFTATQFDLDKLNLRAIALTPKKSRGGWSPDGEDIKTFIEDYKNVMVNAVGYDPKKVGVHCKNFEKGLVKIKNDKPILAKIKELLVLWASKTEAIDENTQIYDWYVARIDKWMKAEEKMTADAF